MSDHNNKFNIQLRNDKKRWIRTSSIAKQMRQMYPNPNTEEFNKGFYQNEIAKLFNILTTDVSKVIKSLFTFDGTNEYTVRGGPNRWVKLTPFGAMTVIDHLIKNGFKVKNTEQYNDIKEVYINSLNQ